ncbi:MAG: hypothetical protein KF775_05750 [Cyclobacteriaceae bacterium]|nr:hypothetical protein [Cyclobacteriaceae bacterium]
MLRLLCGIFFSVWSLSALAQIRMDKLVVQPGKKFLIEGSDILVVDTLILADSAQLILNRAKPENFIHAKVARIGKGCLILGSGQHGANGANGVNGADQPTPCRQAYEGTDGEYGADGENGTTLFIYSDDIQISGSLTINLNGGNGGIGGNGGNGGGGGPGTRVCAGGDGGAGGNGMRGGHGGNGGNITIQCKRCPDLPIWLHTGLQIKNYGGIGGEGGKAGLGGSAGLGTVRDGRNGLRGSHGEEGNAGKSGSVTFTRK